MKRMNSNTGENNYIRSCAFLALLIVLFGIPQFLQGQTVIASAQELGVQPVRLIADPNPSNFRVPAPLELIAKAKKLEKQVAVNIVYLGPGQGMFGDNAIEWPEEAKEAFTFAGQIWGSLLDSNVPITIKACWVDNLPSGTLGHAFTLYYARDFKGAPKNNTWYQIALANSLAGVDLDPNEADMYIGYNSNYSWYLKTDGNCPDDKYDFVSVVAHEICHGLGFAGSMKIENGKGYWGNGSPYPYIYDHFTQNDKGKSLINDFPNNSTELAQQLTSNNLFFSGTNANAAYKGKPPPIYAPSTWEAGSSYSHLAEIFNGTKDALMTYSIPPGESIHNAGPVTQGILKDLGWKMSGGGGTTILEVAPQELSQICQKGQNAVSQSFTVWNSGEGEMQFSISGGAGWVSCSPLSGKSTGTNDKVTVTVNYSTAKLDVGTYKARFTVSAQGAQGSPKYVDITLQIIKQAEIKLDTNEINVYCSLRTNAATEKFTFSNKIPDTILTYSVGKNVDWMTCRPQSGSLSNTDDIAEIEISFNTKNLPIGLYKGYITISAQNTSNSPQTITVNLSVGDINQIPTTNTKVFISFTDTPGSLSFDIFNNVNTWNDISGTKNNLIQNLSAKRRPILQTAFKGVPILYFNGKSYLSTASSKDINSAGPYIEKTVVIFFRTGNDVKERQTILEQGDSARGFNIYLDSGLIYFSVWNRRNDAGPASAWGPIYTFGTIEPETNYVAAILIDANRKILSAYLNNIPLGSKGGVLQLYSSRESLSLGAIKGTTLFHDLKKSSSGFKGYIGALLYYNQILDFQQIVSLSDYLTNKFKNNFSSLDTYSLWFDASKGVIYNENKFVKTWQNTATDKKLRMAQSSKSKMPYWLNQPDAGDAQQLLFNGLQNCMVSNSSAQMNSSKTPYQAKTMLIKFKTNADIVSRQTIWAQGDLKTGLNFYIQNGSLYMGAWNRSGKGGLSWGPCFVSSAIAPNTTHCATLLLNANQSLLEGYLDGVSIGKINGVGALSKHPPATIGASLKRINYADGVSMGNFFKGSIYQTIMYNSALETENIEYLYLYFSGGISSISVNIPPNSQGDYSIDLSTAQKINPSPLTIQIWNSMQNGSKLDFSISSNAVWLICSPKNGISAGENDKIPITVSFETSKLSPGTYSGIISIAAENAINSPISIFVTLKITP